MSTIKHIHKEVDAIAARMTSRGLARPSVEFSINSDVEGVKGYMRWKAPEKTTEDYKFIRGGDPEQLFSRVNAWIDGLPSVEQRKHNDFLKSLAKTIELGKANGISIELVNPLAAVMQTLSENALTYQPSTTPIFDADGDDIPF